MNGQAIENIVSEKRKTTIFSKYTLNNRRRWKIWIKNDFNKWLYSRRFNFNMNGMNGTMLPKLGKGKFVSVYRKKDIILIKDEKSSDEIRIIPYQPNHGIMVEFFKNGIMNGRKSLNIRQLFKSKIYASNIEELSSNRIKDIKLEKELFVKFGNFTKSYASSKDVGKSFDQFIKKMDENKI